MKTMSKTQPTAEGLIGLFGHTYVPDKDGDEGDLMIQYQFEVIRKLEPERYVIQYFGWLDGRPDQCRRDDRGRAAGTNRQAVRNAGQLALGL